MKKTQNPNKQPTDTPLSKREGRICVAKITGAHGIKGFVKLKVFADNPADLTLYAPLFIGEATDQTITLTLKNPVKAHWVAQIEGVTDRNQAEELRGTEIFINESILPPPNENEFYHKDLLGMQVLDNEGKQFGEIIAVQNFGAGDLIEIKPPTGSSFYFPFNKDTCPVIDTDNKTVQTKDIEEYIF